MANRPDATDEFRVHVIDVGQGDSILLDGPDNDTMLVDSGPHGDSGKTVIDYLDEHDIDHLDHLVASHYDADHIGGHTAIIEEFGSDNIGAVHGPEMGEIPPPKTDTMVDFKDVITENDIVVNELEAGTSDLTINGVDIDVLNPSPDNASTDCNENSVVMQCTYGEQSVLLTGDIDRDTEERLAREYSEQLRDVDVLKATHHGSGDGTTMEMLLTCDPETVCFSHGENSNDHPKDETLSRTRAANAEATSNVVHGSTIFTCDGEETISVYHEREAEMRDVADVTAMIHYARAHSRDQLDLTEGIDTAAFPETIPSWAEGADCINTEETTTEATGQSTETEEENQTAPTETQNQDQAWVFGESNTGIADATGKGASSTNDTNESL